MASIYKWKQSDNGILVLQALAYLDVNSLTDKTAVSKKWKKYCNELIAEKTGLSITPFLKPEVSTSFTPILDSVTVI